jgi:hypothetical protein
VDNNNKQKYLFQVNVHNKLHHLDIEFVYNVKQLLLLLLLFKSKNLFFLNNILSNLSVVDNIHHENLKEFSRFISNELYLSLPNKHQHIDSVAEIILHTPEFLQITLLHNVVAEIFEKNFIIKIIFKSYIVIVHIVDRNIPMDKYISLYMDHKYLDYNMHMLLSISTDYYYSLLYNQN